MKRNNKDRLDITERLNHYQAEFYCLLLRILPQTTIKDGVLHEGTAVPLHVMHTFINRDSGLIDALRLDSVRLRDHDQRIVLTAARINYETYDITADEAAVNSGCFLADEEITLRCDTASLEDLSLLIDIADTVQKRLDAESVIIRGPGIHQLVYLNDTIPADAPQGVSCMPVNGLRGLNDYLKFIAAANPGIADEIYIES